LITDDDIEKVRPEVFSLELDAIPRVLFDRNHLDQVMWGIVDTDWMQAKAIWGPRVRVH